MGREERRRRRRRRRRPRRPSEEGRGGERERREMAGERERGHSLEGGGGGDGVVALQFFLSLKNPPQTSPGGGGTDGEGARTLSHARCTKKDGRAPPSTNKKLTPLSIFPRLSLSPLVSTLPPVAAPGRDALHERRHRLVRRPGLHLVVRAVGLAALAAPELVGRRLDGLVKGEREKKGLLR